MATTAKKASSRRSAARSSRDAEVILGRLAAVNPDPRCELFYQSPYQLLVSVVLSAQATDKSVNRCMEPIYRAGFTPETAVAWGEQGLLAKIRSIGLAPTKAKNVVKLSHILLERYDGQVPNTREALEALPGVGRKTASVILGELFAAPTLAVDTHVYRVTQRLGLQHEKTPEKAEQALMKIIPRQFLPKAHHWFILLGRYVCKAQKPLCGECCLTDICPSAWPQGKPETANPRAKSGPSGHKAKLPKRLIS